MIMLDKDCKKIETGPDKLLELINQREEIRMADAANLLKIPIYVTEQWCETLEEAGLLVKKITLKDTVIMSLDHYRRNTRIKSFMQNVKSISYSTREYNEEMLHEKEIEIQKNMKILNEKITELKKLREYRRQMESEIQGLEEREKRLLNLNLKIAKKANDFEKETLAFKDKSEEIAKKDRSLKEKQVELNVKLEQLKLIRDRYEKEDLLLQKRQKKIAEAETIFADAKEKEKEIKRFEERILVQKRENDREKESLKKLFCRIQEREESLAKREERLKNWERLK